MGRGNTERGIGSTVSAWALSKLNMSGRSDPPSGNSRVAGMQTSSPSSLKKPMQSKSWPIEMSHASANDGPSLSRD